VCDWSLDAGSLVECRLDEMGEMKGWFVGIDVALEDTASVEHFTTYGG
jgi:hypothetical protein